MAENIDVKVMKRVDGEWKLLLKCWLQFWEREAVSSAIPGFRSKNGKEVLKIILEDLYLSTDDPIVIAWDKEKEKVAGFAINQVLNKDSKPIFTLSDYSWQDITTEEMKRYDNFWTDFFASKLDYFHKYQIDKAFETFIVSVSKEYTNKGIASKLAIKSLKVAKEMGISHAIGTATNTYAQKIALQFGYETVLERKYEDTCELYRSIPKEIALQHGKCLLMAKKL